MEIDRGLIVYEQYANMLVRGYKRRELRTFRTKIRGPIAIISRSRVLGIVLLKDVHGPFSVDELEDYYELHRVNRPILEGMFGSKPIWAREMEPLIVFKEPLRIRIKRGARIRTRIEPPLIIKEI